MMEITVAKAGPESDKLSEMEKAWLDKELAKLAQSLKAPDRRKEAALRKKLHQLRSTLIQYRFELGETLAGYRRLYKQKREWTRFCAAIGVNVRTAHRIIDGYKLANQVDPVFRTVAAANGIDLARNRYGGLAKSLASNMFADGGLTKGTAKSFFTLELSKLQSKPVVPLLPAKVERGRVEAAYEYVKKTFEDIPAVKRREELLTLYTKLNAYFGIEEEMKIAFVSSPVLVGPASEVC